MSIPFSEDELIARLFAPLTGPGGLGLRDDAALISPPAGRDLIVTTDAIVAGVHFFPDDPPDTVARKALRVNLSDLAAKGADPLGFLLTLALPPGLPNVWLETFAAALGEDCQTYKIDLLGGDTVKTPGPLMVSITALGSAPAGAMVRRTGARAGDQLFISGTIGDAAIGLKMRAEKTFLPRLGPGARAALIARYLEPRPRNALTLAMRECARGGMDISDGCVGDIRKMLAASGVTGRVNLTNIPISGEARAAIALDAALFETALTGGDDYELLASVPPENAARFEAMARGAGVPVTRIGEVVEGAGPPVFIDANGAAKTFARGSFSHF